MDFILQCLYLEQRFKSATFQQALETGYPDIRQASGVTSPLSFRIPLVLYWPDFSPERLTLKEHWLDYGQHPLHPVL